MSLVRTRQILVICLRLLPVDVLRMVESLWVWIASLPFFVRPTAYEMWLRFPSRVKGKTWWLTLQRQSERRTKFTTIWRKIIQKNVPLEIVSFRNNNLTFGLKTKFSINCVIDVRAKSLIVFRTNNCDDDYIFLFYKSYYFCLLLSNSLKFWAGHPDFLSFWDRSYEKYLTVIYSAVKQFEWTFPVL